MYVEYVKRIKSHVKKMQKKYMSLTSDLGRRGP
jgi:hypothetical protein